MRREQTVYAAVGLQIVLIGLGTPDRAQEFREALDLPFQVLCDPEKISYQAFGLLRRLNVLREANPLSVWNFVADSTRYGLGSSDQDIMQLGGVFVVDQTGTVCFVFEAMRASERPKTADVVQCMTKRP